MSTSCIYFLNLRIDLVNLLAHGEQIANIFSNCTHNHVIGSGNVVYSEKALLHELEKAQLQIAKLQAEKEKAELEARYLKEKYEKIE